MTWCIRRTLLISAQETESIIEENDLEAVMNNIQQNPISAYASDKGGAWLGRGGQVHDILHTYMQKPALSSPFHYIERPGHQSISSSTDRE